MNGSPAYAAFGRRLSAMVIDSVVLATVFIIIVIGGDSLRNLPGSGRVLAVAIYALVLLYEPLLVWRFGATIGHRATNLRVVDDRTGGNPGLARAFARFAVKALLGLWLFFAMLFTRRHQAVHDLVTHTTVQIRDLSQARLGDYHAERVAEPADSTMPSARRRILIALLYCAAWYVGGAFAVVFVGTLAGIRDRTVLEDIFSLGWIGGTLIIALAGWRGQLLGARRSRLPSPLEPQGDGTVVD